MNIVCYEFVKPYMHLLSTYTKQQFKSYTFDLPRHIIK